VNSHRLAFFGGLPKSHFEMSPVFEINNVFHIDEGLETQVLYLPVGDPQVEMMVSKMRSFVKETFQE
jgi:hypothetical protein